MIGRGDWKTVVILFALVFATASGSPAQTFKSLYQFNGSDGEGPYLVTLVQGPAGDLYGTTANGGDLNCDPPNGCGTVFRMNLAGKLKTLHVFEGMDGMPPYAGLILASDGNFYGTTARGGDLTCAPPYGCGTLFKISFDGILTTMHTFELIDGALPLGALLQAADGNLYGTTGGGGVNAGSGGTLFKMTLQGVFATLYSFCADPPNCSDGAGPVAGLIQATNGNFFGTTAEGGNILRLCNSGCGTVFRLTPAGKFTTIHKFHNVDGANVWAPLMQAADGNLYGTTQQGGKFGGVIYKITPTDQFTVFHNFDGMDGCCLLAPAVQATDGNLYGITWQGGDYSYDGTIFRINAAGVLTTLYSFCGGFNCAQGGYPTDGLLQDTNGIFYAPTGAGGKYDDGTIFSLDVGLGPFISLVRSAGRVGTREGILGQGFTGATDVSFNGAPATFNVKADTFITATIPPGATSGFVTVTTPTGTLTSNKQFVVLP